MEKYYGYYKCRRCGAKFIRVEAENFKVAFDNMLELVNNENPALPKLFAYHLCHKIDTDIIALADFIGFEKE